jgi:hypothetical protein
MANIFLYKHRITVVPFSLTIKTFALVLLALVDANYKFNIIDVGGYGKSSDEGLFARSTLGKSLEDNTINIYSTLNHCLRVKNPCPL